MYYGDESGLESEPRVPYGWQFEDEQVAMPTGRGKAVNLFGLFSRDNRSWTSLSEENITSKFVIDELDRFSMQIKRLTVVVLDNARIHHTKELEKRASEWQNRGLYIFYLPRYSPHLNIAETVWRKLKYEWLAPGDYQTKEQLRYRAKQALASFGTILKINFSRFDDAHT